MDDPRSITSRFVAIVAALTTVSASAAEISLKAEVASQGTVVRLGDVAEIAATDSREAQRLASVPLMPAPVSGDHRFLRQREVRDLLAAHGEDMSRHAFRGPAAVQIHPPTTPSANLHVDPSDRTVTRFRAAWTGKPFEEPSATAMVRPEPGLSTAQVDNLRNNLNELFVEYLENVSGRKANWRVKFELPTTALASLASATSPLKCMGGNTPWTGRQRLIVTFTSPTGMTRVPLYVEASCSRSAVVAIRPIERGAIVTAADVEVQAFEDIPAATIKQAPYESIEPILGMEAARTIQMGDILTTDDVRPQILVERGEQIAVFARGGGIQVRTIARSKQDGARGDLITVESLDKRKPFQAVVTGKREALVFAGGAAPLDGSLAKRPVRNSQSQ